MKKAKPRRSNSRRTSASSDGTSGAAENGTRERLLDAAETMFSKYGPHGVSLREIVDHAKANIAAVNYYFGSKDELFDEVVARSIGRLAGELVAALDETAQDKRGDLTLDDILASFLRGGLRAELRVYFRLRTWMGMVNPTRATELLAEFFDPMTNRYVDALGAVLPALSRAELGWRLYLVSAALLFTAFDANRLGALTGGKVQSSDTAAVIANLVPLLADGMRGAGGIREKVPSINFVETEDVTG
jgi:AcrR family transcriptional regulator